MASRLSVIISQGQSRNPQKRQLEEDITAGLLMEPGIEVTIIPHLYDLRPDGTGILALQGVAGNMVVCSWLFERASHWVLDRHKVHGHVGTTLIQPDEDDEEDDEEFADEVAEKDRVIDSRDIPNRSIYCLDLRIRESAADYIEEVKRIATECSRQVVGIGDTIPQSNGSTKSTVTPEQLARFENPTNDTALAKDGNGLDSGPAQGLDMINAMANGTHDDLPMMGEPTRGEPKPGEPTRIEEQTGRRWYPVIDFSRCTNCMECIDFCLFGVYGVDAIDTILVEQPDNCRKGCPACSRVCPENAIMFPQHKTPAIAGAAETAAGLKIDLSLLFGAPESGKTADEIAAMERDEQLLAAGRDAVGMSVGMPKRHKPADAADAQPRDELDNLVDQLDDLDL